MLRHKNIDRICCIVLAAVILLTVCLMGAADAGVIVGNPTLGYENRLFDQSRVHVIDIVMDDWEGFLGTCMSEEYSPCTVIIDGESFSNAGIRGKGNTSLSSVSRYGNDRYSFKVEFDHYQTGMTYHGLDKLSLNNLIQDKTLMKDYVAYTLMNKMGVSAPLCSFAQIRVNGEDWGFYLAVEGVEDSFLKRNYGSDYGELYKPDSMSFGGGRGNGRDFDMSNFAGQFPDGVASGAGSDENSAAEENTGGFNPFGMNGMEPPEGFDPSQVNGMEPPEGFDPSQVNGMEPPEGFDPSQMNGMEPPEGFDPSQMNGMEPPEGFDPSQMNGMQPPEG
ncbi:MAG: CotH kinase family protein, partial [Clostridia bacterium]|nr:CotH kinase family protein [Clostridia bacterium]